MTNHLKLLPVLRVFLSSGNGSMAQSAYLILLYYIRLNFRISAPLWKIKPLIATCFLKFIRNLKDRYKNV